jgi:hypothetical protein
MANQTELAISLQYKGGLFRVESERIEEEYKRDDKCITSSLLFCRAKNNSVA